MPRGFTVPGQAYDPITGELLTPEEQDAYQSLQQSGFRPVEPMGPVAPEPTTGNPELDQRLAGMASGFGDRNVPDYGAAESIGYGAQAAAYTLPLLDTARGAVAAGLTPDTGMGFTDRVKAGALEPGKFPFRNAAGIRNLSDTDIALGLSPRDIVGGIADIGLDPSNYIPLGALGKTDDVARATGRSIAREAGESSTKGILRDAAEGAPGAIQRATDVPFRPRLSGASEVAESTENVFTAPPTLKRLFGTGDIVEGQQRGLAERVGMTGRVKADNPVVTPAFLVRDESRQAVVNQATRITAEARTVVKRSGFATDDTGRIPSLGGIDPTLRAAVMENGELVAKGNMIPPTLRDVAARYPVYEPHLNPQQRAAMERIREMVAPYREALTEVADEESLITGAASDIKFGVRADVMEGGFYIPRGTAETDELADIAAQRLKGRSGNSGTKGFEKSASYPSEAAGIADGYRYTPVAESMGGYVRGAGNRAIDRHTANYLLSRVDETGARIASEAAGDVDRTAGRISLSGLRNYEFPWQIADEAESIIRAETKNPSEIDAALRAVNGVMRGVQATGEMSNIGIQMAIGAFTDPVGFGRAAKASVRAWGNSGDEVMGGVLKAFDTRAVKAGRPASEEWAASGLRLGESGTEFRVGGRKLPDKVQAIAGAPVIKQALRAPKELVERSDRGFGVGGDTMRLELADTLAEESILKGRALSRQEMRTIAESVNRVTGWTPQRAAGNWGEAVNFAPRYLMSRVRTLGQLASTDPRKRQLARRLVGRYMAIGSTLTVLANAANGEETDFRPFSGKNGPTFDPREAEYKNPNFMRVRNVLNRDWSLLGPMDSLFGMVVGAGSLVTNPTGDPKEMANRLRAVFTAPITSAGLDWMAFGENFEGERLTLDSEAGMKDLVRRVVPFGASQLAEAGGEAADYAQADGAVGAAREIAGGIGEGFFGGRGSDLTTRERVLIGEYDSLPPLKKVKALPSKTWADLSASALPGSFSEEVAKYPNYFAWEQATLDQYRKLYREAGERPELVSELAENALEKNPLGKLYSEVKNFHEREFIIANPELSIKIMGEDANKPKRERRLSISLPELEFMRLQPKQ